jgi:hypothetical protein
VLTASVVNRCDLTSLSWFKVPVRGFAPDAHRAALSWLERERLFAAVMSGLARYQPANSKAPFTRVA